MDAFGFPVMAAEVGKLDNARVPRQPASSSSTVSTSSSASDVGTAEKPRTMSGASILSGGLPGGNAATTANGAYYNPVVISFIRDDWIKKQLVLRQDEYTVYQKTHIVTGTWNVNAKKPMTSADTAKLVEWLQRRQQGQPGSPVLPDIIALGFQEIVDLNAVNVVVSNQSGQRSTQWEEAILSALNQHISNNQYKLVMSRNLVGILLVVIVRQDHVDSIRDVYGSTAGVGIMGMMGNKGGAAVRLTFYDSTICFVCAHLAAHRENVAGRNSDYMNILSKIEFKDANEDALASTVRSQSGESPILNHDFVFWIGDLNYRITDEMSTEECFQYAESGKFGPMLAKEQLLIERKRGNVFHDFEEGPIRFAPTYKYQAGTHSYDKRPEKKIRAPAWCDRVLWKAKFKEHVTLLHYDAVRSLDLSDHKPVHAFFDVQIKHEVQTKKSQVSREIMLQIDKWENDNMPKVRLLNGEDSEPISTVLDFPHLKYGLEQTKTIVIENVGSVVAQFQFIPKLEEVTICKPWLRVTPSYGMIPPREKVVIRISARIDEETAQVLSSGVETLDDTMILRIEAGRDYFLLVSGQYDVSCFGTTLEQLIGCTEPVRQSIRLLASSSSSFKVDHHPHQNQQRESESTQSPSAAQTQKIPKELWRVVNDLFQNSMMEKNLFVEGGNKQELVLLREALDTGLEFPSHSSYSMAELLLAWLQSLRQSVVPDDVIAQALANGGGNVAQTCRMLLDTLPPVRYNVLVYIIAFLKEVLKHVQGNKLTPEKLAFVFSRCLVTQYKPPHQHKTSNAGDEVNAQQTGSSSPPASTASSTANTASTATPGSSVGSNQSFPEERLRQTAREAEIAQWNSTQRTEKMEKMLVYWFTTGAM